MKNIIFILLLFVSTFSFGQARNNNANVYNVLLFGADRSGATDATTAIQNAINACDAAGGGVVFFPDGIYKISGALGASNAQLFIPVSAASAATRNHIILRGESKPNFIPVGGGLVAGAGNPAITTGVVLQSSLTSGATGAAVIGTAGSFNYTYLTVENMTVLVKNNPAGGGPVVGGISYKNGSSLVCKSVVCSIDTSGSRSTLPSNNVSGIETPDQGSENFNLLENTLCNGFKQGYKIGEHVTLTNSVAWCNYYGFYVKLASIPTVATRIESLWNAYDVYGGGIATLANWNLETEWQQIGKWYDYIAMVKDSANILQGQIAYTYTFAGGTPLTVVLKSGASQLNLTPHSEGTASGYLNRAVLPIITAGSLDSTTLVGGVGTLSSLILKATTNASANAVMRFLTDNTAKVLRMKGLVISTPAGVNLGIGTITPNANAGYGGITMNGSTGAILDQYVNGTPTGKMFSTTNQLAHRSSSKYVIQVNGNTATNAIEIATTGTTNLFKGGNVTSASTITITGNVFHVTGTNTITSVSGTSVIGGTTITIIFDAALTFTDGSNLKLAGDFVTTADDTITLTYDGTNWYEVARAIN